MDSSRTLPQRAPGAAPEPAGALAATRHLAVPARARITRQAREPPAVRPQEIVLGRYRLLERLGAGGFGVVWSAHDELLHREVALKRIWLGAEGISERASREALASARLRHPAIVALYEACARDGAFYLISELVEGATLAQLISAGELTDDHALAIGLALVGALAHAHARGVIHRDIKPQNVLVPAHVEHQRESAKLTDFGGASLAGEDALTRTGDVLGTLAYMAPEQSEGAEVGEEADLYALALVLYESLSGANPVRGPTPAATVRRIGRRIEPLARSRRDLPRELCSALDLALSPAPAERGTLDDLGYALEDTLDQGAARTRRRFARPRRPGAVAAVEPRQHEDPPQRAAEHAYQQRAEEQEHEHAHEQEPELPHARPTPSRAPALPRWLWLAFAFAFVLWEALSGLAGVSLLVLVALAPALFVRGEDGSARLPLARASCALAPVFGLIGLAGAFPAVAGQARAAVERAARGAIGYWWLLLAGPLLGKLLWLPAPATTPPRSEWEGSITATAVHVIAPTLTLAALLGALVWAAAALVLPWIVRGRSAAFDALAAAAWAAALALAERALNSNSSTQLAHAEPRGAVLGAVAGAVIAIAARAMRGPV